MTLVAVTDRPKRGLGKTKSAWSQRWGRAPLAVAERFASARALDKRQNAHIRCDLSRDTLSTTPIT
jgi:hypothetical protein